MAQEGSARPDVTAVLTSLLNLTAFHREHEQFYSTSPREQSVVLQRHSRTLHALADRWATTEPAPRHALNPFEGASDLNAPAALQLTGVLFMEGAGEPTEIAQMKRELRRFAEDAQSGGEWLTKAMEGSWAGAALLLEIGDLADVLGERHRIIANNWQGAAVLSLAAQILRRSVELLDVVEMSTAALRADLAGERRAAKVLSSAAEMIDHAADLFSEFAGLVHDNERRWRVFRSRVAAVLADTSGG